MDEEAANLKKEFIWLLRSQVGAELKKIHSVLMDCSQRFPSPLQPVETKKQDKFVLSSDQIKCIVTLTGDSITHADINFKVHRHSAQVQRTTIVEESPWKLQQIQDAANFLQIAIRSIDDVDSSSEFNTGAEVLHILKTIQTSLQHGRSSLVVPKKKPIDELMQSRNMKSLSPNLPEDLAISFYIQSHKLIFAAYQLTNVQGTMKFDSCQSECLVPWLNEVLVLFTVALQLAQQLKDKVSVFEQYSDFNLDASSSSTPN